MDEIVIPGQGDRSPSNGRHANLEQPFGDTYLTTGATDCTGSAITGSLVRESFCGQGSDTDIMTVDNLLIAAAAPASLSPPSSK
jgi:hypothetical protein